MNREPIYNIGVVSRMTGIPENTLRIWERRYRFPSATRTEGGHRLYSPLEVARILWVKQHIDQGMQTRNAIQALEHAERSDQFTVPSLEPPESAQPAASDQVIRDRLFEALVSLDKRRAEMVIGDALAVHSLEHLVLNVIAPTFTAIGSAWEQERISISTEHFATNYLRHKLLMWMQMSPSEYAVRPVILACAPGELHEGGLLMLGLMLQRLRWPVIYLGQSVDLPDLASFIQTQKPSLVVFVAMTEESARALSEWPRWLGTLDDGTPPRVAYAGYIFAHDPSWIERVPGIYLGDTLMDGVSTADRLLHQWNPFAG